MAVAARRLEGAAPAPAPARPSRSGGPRTARPPRPAARRVGFGRPLLWIGLVTALLAGIVALNVAVLQLRMERGRVADDVEQVRAENAGLRAEIAIAAAPGRIERIARAELGLVAPGELAYVTLPPAK
jgi:cell division protein FtsL